MQVGLEEEPLGRDFFMAHQLLDVSGVFEEVSVFLEVKFHALRGELQRGIIEHAALAYFHESVLLQYMLLVLEFPCFPKGIVLGHEAG